MHVMTGLAMVKENSGMRTNESGRSSEGVLLYVVCLESQLESLEVWMVEMWWLSNGGC